MCIRDSCYAYEESVRSTDDYNYKNKQDYWNGKEPLNKWKIDVNQGRNIWLDNGGKSPYVTYQQLSDQGEDGVKAWLNAKGAAFSFVTTTETVSYTHLRARSSPSACTKIQRSST